MAEPYQEKVKRLEIQEMLHNINFILHKSHKIKQFAMHVLFQ